MADSFLHTRHKSQNPEPNSEEANTLTFVLKGAVKNAAIWAGMCVT